MAVITAESQGKYGRMVEKQKTLLVGVFLFFQKRFLGGRYKIKANSCRKVGM